MLKLSNMTNTDLKFKDKDPLWSCSKMYKGYSLPKKYIFIYIVKNLYICTTSTYKMSIAIVCVLEV